MKLAAVLLAACAAPVPRPAPPKPASDVIDPGASPRRMLVYPTAGIAHAVTLTWRGSAHYTDSHSRTNETIRFVGRTLQGERLELSPGRFVVALLTGTSPPHQKGLRLDGWRDEYADLDRDLPIRLTFSIDPRRVQPDLTASNDYALWAYQDVIAAALPGRLPAEPVGRGARWRVVSKDGWHTTTMTWEVTGFDGNTVTLHGTGAGATWGGARPAIDVHTSMDLATWSLDATIVRSSLSLSSNALTDQMAETHDEATLSCGPRVPI